MRKRKRQLDSSLRVLRQIANELSYFIEVEPISSREQTVERLTWLRGRIGEAVFAIQEDREPESFPEALVD